MTDEEPGIGWNLGGGGTKRVPPSSEESEQSNGPEAHRATPPQGGKAAVHANLDIRRWAE